MLGKAMFVCVVCVLAACVGAQAQTELGFFQTVERIQAEGYPAETHHVESFNGYILEMHRIPHGSDGADNITNRPPVFLMHGLMSASNAYIAIGANYSIAYNLADAGFDVWMGNARGNYHSRRHTSLDPDDEIEKFAFFDFTFEEIGLHDLHAMIDYVLEQTRSPQLHYIGHSQGGTTFLVLTTLRPEYNDKIASAHLLAAVGYQDYFPNEPLIALSANVDEIYAFSLASGIVELYPELLNPSALGNYKVSDYCTGNVKQRYMCELYGIRHILRDDDTAIATTAGASLKQAAHYGQNIRDKLFRRYHYGTDNMNIYGLEEPPLYNLSLITCDVTMHYSMNDNLLDERDVLAMVADMPNARARRVARDSFEHGDFAVALDAKELVTDYIIEALKNKPIVEPDLEDGGSGVEVVDNNTSDSPGYVTTDYTTLSTPSSDFDFPDCPICPPPDFTVARCTCPPPVSDSTPAPTTDVTYPLDDDTVITDDPTPSIPPSDFDDPECPICPPLDFTVARCTCPPSDSDSTPASTTAVTGPSTIPDITTTPEPDSASSIALNMTLLCVILMLITLNNC